MKALDTYDTQQQVVVVVHHGMSKDGDELIARCELCETPDASSGAPTQ